MSYKEMIKELNLPNEKQFLELFKRKPADPIVYLLRVQDKVGVNIQDYYKILEQKYKEEKNEKMSKAMSEIIYVMRDR